MPNNIFKEDVILFLRFSHVLTETITEPNMRLLSRRLGYMNRVCLGHKCISYRLVSCQQVAQAV